MSWASQRNTTRVEDKAYCLMGLFDVNMPLLYGEGMKAFVRLQEEIIKNSDDQSIFLWTVECPSYSTFRGLLAKSPEEFKVSGDVPILPSVKGEPYFITNRGLRISLPCSKIIQDGPEILGLLSCDLEAKTQFAIRMIRLGTSSETNQFARVDPGNIVQIENKATAPAYQDQLLYVRNEIRFLPDFATDRIAGFSLLDFKPDISDYSVWPKNDWLLDEMFYRFQVSGNDSLNVLERPRATIFTARILWHTKLYLNDAYLLFEFRFNTGPTTLVLGLASLLDPRTIPQYGFCGTRCWMNRSYDISRVPLLQDIRYKKVMAFLKAKILS